MKLLRCTKLVGIVGILSGVSIRTFASTASMASAGGSVHPRVSLGAGCYWGTEKYIKKNFNEEIVKNSVKSGAVGFMNPNPHAPPNPTYREVCSGTTGFVEVFDVELGDNSEETFEKLIRYFFTFHDPTTFNRQGMDMGSQYASVIFTYDQRQAEIAQRVKAEVQGMVTKKTIPNYAGPEVSTAILPATQFYKAEEEHQEYLFKNQGGYCNHFVRFQWHEPVKEL